MFLAVLWSTYFADHIFSMLVVTFRAGTGERHASTCRTSWIFIAPPATVDLEEYNKQKDWIERELVEKEKRRKKNRLPKARVKWCQCWNEPRSITAIGGRKYHKPKKTWNHQQKPMVIAARLRQVNAWIHNRQIYVVKATGLSSRQHFLIIMEIESEGNRKACTFHSCASTYTF